MKYIKFIGLAFLTMFLFVSCEQEEGAIYNGNIDKAVSFPSSKLTQELIDEDGNELVIKLQRAQTTGSLDVPVRFTTSSTLFQMSDTVFHFADGESVALNKITHPGASALGVGVNYSLKLVVDTTKVARSVSGIKTMNININRKLTWKNKGKGTFTSNDVTGTTYEVDIISPEEAPNIYKALSLYADKYDILIIVDKVNGKATIPQQEIGLSLFGEGYPKTWLRADACTYSNGVITVVPGNSTKYNRWLVVPAPGTTGAWVSSSEILVLPQGSY
jgi:hypothetical protein